MVEDETSIREACKAFGHAIQAMDPAAMRRLWDYTFDHLVYQPEEYERPCRNWDEIVSYLSYIPGVAVVGDVAIVYSLVMTSFQIKDAEEPLEGEVRFTFGLRRTPEGWLPGQRT